jgi:hypothetical protein
MQVAFDALKKALTSASCLALPDQDGEFEVMGAIYAIFTCRGHNPELTANQPTNHPVCQSTIPSANAST